MFTYHQGSLRLLSKLINLMKLKLDHYLIWDYIPKLDQSIKFFL
jgi:hypothetical protein